MHIDLTRRFYDYMFYSIRKLHSILYEKNSNLEEINRQHGRMLGAIERGDSEEAGSSMLEHITFLRTFLSNSALAK